MEGLYRLPDEPIIRQLDWKRVTGPLADAPRLPKAFASPGQVDAVLESGSVHRSGGGEDKPQMSAPVIVVGGLDGGIVRTGTPVVAARGPVRMAIEDALCIFIRPAILEGTPLLAQAPSLFCPLHLSVDRSDLAYGGVALPARRCDRLGEPGRRRGEQSQRSGNQYVAHR